MSREMLNRWAEKLDERKAILDFIQQVTEDSAEDVELLTLWLGLPIPTGATTNTGQGDGHGSSTRKCRTRKPGGLRRNAQARR